MAQDKIGVEAGADDEADTPPDEDPNAVHFHFIKSAYFRVVHVDGAYGGPTARGYIHAAVYSERAPIPRRTRAPILNNNTLGSEEIVSIKRHAIREVEVDLVFDLSTAKAFREWLDDKINVLEKVFSVQETK